MTVDEKGIFIKPSSADIDTSSGADINRCEVTDSYPPEEKKRETLIDNNPPSPQEKKQLKGRRKEPVIFDADTLQHKIARLLLKYVLRNNPNAKVPADTPEALATWARTIDLLMKEGREPRDIKDVITWCQDDDFWCSNILNPTQLRSKYDQLWLKMKKERGRPRGYNSPDLYR